MVCEDVDESKKLCGKGRKKEVLIGGKNCRSCGGQKETHEDCV